MPIPINTAIFSQYRVITEDEISDELLNWTPQAYACYKRKCNCQGCFINETIETKCYMNVIVNKILKTIGEPNV